MSRFDLHVAFSRPAALLLATCAAVGASDAAAQIRSARPVGVRVAHERAFVGGQLLGGLPTGEFANFVDGSLGLGAHAVINVGDSRAFGIRVDGGFLVYNRDVITRPLSPTVPFIDVDIETNNMLFNAGVGPQFTLGRGSLRPYVYGTIGFTYLFTESNVRGTSDIEPFASTTNFDDFTFAGTLGAGLLIRLSRGKTPIYLDFAGKFLANGEAEYLTEGSLQELPGGGLLIAPVRSGTNMFVLQAGLSVGLR